MGPMCSKDDEKTASGKPKSQVKLARNSKNLMPDIDALDGADEQPQPRKREIFQWIQYEK